ncbi:MAG: TraC family protein [Deltaproteobacteria bacterium]|nr:TraC family protein [Deltaproteobacteria bacterium]
MSIARITRERLYQDEALFNQLLPFARYDEDTGLFVHSDASLWSIWELQPLLLTSTSDSQAYQTCAQVQELLDSLDHNISAQFSWVVTFDVDDVLQKSLNQYPLSGVSGWMARRWNRMLQRAAKSNALAQRPRKMRLVVGFRYNPPWKRGNFVHEMMKSIKILLAGKVGVSAQQRRAEYLNYANKFKGEIEGKVARMRDVGFYPQRIDGQGLINLLYPILNRKSVKSGRFKRGRQVGIPVPVFEKDEYLANQISETPVEHPRDGIIKKDGRVFRTISMVKPPNQCFPLMIAPLQSAPYENIISVTYSKDPQGAQIKRLDTLDSTLGLREFTSLGRSNQKIQHQIRSIRQARESLYNNAAQIVRVGVHQTFICQNEDEAVRATSEGMAAFPQLNGARGMVHEIADLGVMIHSLPGCYDPSLDGRGWTNTMRSSRAIRMLPLWGNWKGSKGALFLLPNLWNRELVGFDLFDSNIAPNVLISGVSGAGKSYLLNFILITLNRGHYATLANGTRAERPPITFVFDKGMPNQPCGFEKIAHLFNGRVYEATPSKAPAMNFLARLGETPHDNTNEDFKDLIDICSDIIADMATEKNQPLSRLQIGDIITALLEAHRMYRAGPRKRQFILSDVVAVLRAPKRVDEDEPTALRRNEIALLMSEYYGEGTYARFFDRPGALKLKERFIVFDLKGLSRNPDLQRVFLKIAMLWADEVMNDPKELDSRKVLVFDEAHDLIGKTASGVIESAFRLYRKRKGIVIAASQSGEDFYVGAGGQAIVQNSAHKIFLRQDPSKFHMTAKAFNLNEQQSDVILRLRTIKGVESQFYLLSDIGEAALVLPLEPAYYWVSTNNGDDNQLFMSILQECNGNYPAAIERASIIAPSGASAFNQYRQAILQAEQAGGKQPGSVAQTLNNVFEQIDNSQDQNVQEASQA